MRPVRIGECLTRGRAQRGQWRRTTYGFYVPAATPTCPEQRVLEQSMRAGPRGAVSGWAALRLHGAAYFEGDGRPVLLLTDRQLTPDDGSVGLRRPLPPGVVTRYGVRVVPVEAALADEIEQLDDDRDAAVAIEMTCAAHLTSLLRLRAQAATEPRRRRRPLLRAIDLAHERSESPAESRMRHVWMLDAGLPEPACNRIVYALDGRVLGKPDLLDVELGVVGEYNGEQHRERERHRRDTVRFDAFRDAGLEYFDVVAGDSVEVQVARMHAARRRASAQVGVRGWTLDPPPGSRRPGELSLDDQLDRLDARRRELGE